MSVTIFTIGHSTRPIDEFIRMLQAHGIHLLLDVRTVPKSRYNPQFAKEALEASLPGGGIAYRHMPGLGGLRHARKDSTNTGWRNDSFRGYADYMQTPEFDTNLRALIDLGRAQPTVVMCAEAVPWRCHRSLISDALLARGIPVEHIMSETQRNPHKLTSFAVVEGERVTYPPETLTLDLQPGA